MMSFRRQFVLLFALVAALLGHTVPAFAQTQTVVLADAAALDDAVRPDLDAIEAALGRSLSAAELAGLRARIDPIRDRIAAGIAEVEPRAQEARERLTQLGPRPAENAAPEAADVRTQREDLTRGLAAIDARVRQLRVIQVRSDQLSDRITDRRRQMFAAQLMERTTSVLDPRFWSDLAAAGPVVLRTSSVLALDVWRHLTVQVGPSSLMAAAIVSLLAAGILLFVYRNLRRRGLYDPPADVPASRVSLVLADLRVAAERSLVLPILIVVGVVIVRSFNLAPPRVEPLEVAILIAAAVVALTRGIMQGVLAPGAPAYRLVDLSDSVAEAVYRSSRQAAWVIAAAVVLLAFARILVAPVIVTVVITSAMAMALVVIAFDFLRRSAPRADDDETEPAQQGNAIGWVRPALWVLIVAVTVALAAGYVALGSFLASRVAAFVVIAAATVLVLRLVDALIADVFGADTSRGRAIASTIGIMPTRLELIGTLIGGFLRVAVLFAAFVAVIGPWGFGGIGAALDSDLVGLRVSELSAWGTSILGAAFVILVGALILRAVLAWVRGQVLPRSGLDSGLQNSVSTILGYAGVALIIGLGLRQLGLDLSNLTIVAGALSVGIGFGLQSIVSNFVSGLILLAERPIRVGDSIVVKGEEGHVKKISVRSTEIETFDRATVILPNADLISGVVKNWTHSNTTGRITVSVRVAYDIDAQIVRDELMAAAMDQPLLVKEPPPRVFLMRFGDQGLEFELRCIVTDIDRSLSVKSDLQLAILKRFRDRGIIIAPPIQRVQDDVGKGDAGSKRGGRDD